MSLGPKLHPDWLIPQWPAPENVRALCTTRAAGTSQVPYDSMNLGDHVGDVVSHVAQNRVLLHDAMNARPVFLKQVHGTRVVAHGPHVEGPLLPPLQADACITRHPGVACTIMVADCLPVLLTNRQGTLVGAAHAGWRGLAGEIGTGVGGSGDADTGKAASGVLEAICQQFYQQFHPTAADDILVWLGPCIGPLKFEVGNDVRDVFVAHDSAAEAMFKLLGAGKWLADLAGLARLRLRAMGVNKIYGNDGSPAWCTVSNASRFFSHRRDSVTLGGSGRMAASIWLG